MTQRWALTKLDSEHATEGTLVGVYATRAEAIAHTPKDESRYRVDPFVEPLVVEAFKIG